MKLLKINMKLDHGTRHTCYFSYSIFARFLLFFYKDVLCCEATLVITVNYGFSRKTKRFMRKQFVTWKTKKTNYNISERRRKNKKSGFY